MRPPNAYLVDNASTGFWRVYARPMRADPVDITFVRGVPTLIDSLTTTDPFGPAEATLTLPKVSVLDQVGPGTDLPWLYPEVDVDIVWTPLPTGDGTDWRYSREQAYYWEGFVTNFGWSYAEASGQLTLQLKGAMQQLDYYLAMPEYLYQPIPFERAIYRQFANHPGLRLGAMVTTWPSWWSRIYTKDTTLPPYMQPSGVTEGRPWTGLLTRETGQREPALTSYVQGLLASMWTERGRWTLMLEQGRVPVLFHRDVISDASKADLAVDVAQPGLSLELNQDYAMRANVIYGQGRSLAGVTYSGMQVTPSGARTYYAPFASLPSVHPDRPEDNPNRVPETMRHEISLSFYQGLTPEASRTAAMDHLRRFADPGVVGTMTLTASDPRTVSTDQAFPRQLLQAGMNIRLDGFGGRRPGPTFHITESQVSVTDNSAVLTLDTRFRDQLTVQEVMLRGRDALTVTRLLTPGQYQPNIPDQLLPWDYSLGSGALPLGSKSYFNGAPETMVFPWLDWVRKHPPSRHPEAFVRIGPVDNRDASKNWNVTDINTKSQHLLLSQSGDVKLFQVAAFRADGELAPVSFHVSVYSNPDTSYQDMPSLPGSFDAGRNRRYAAGQYYPFFPNAWEQYDETGKLYDDVGQVVAEGANMQVGYGNFYARAGYWPNSYDTSATPTGMLVDETGFSYDGTNEFDPTGYYQNTFEESGRFAVLIYCDDQGTEPVYFLGRAWRREYGTA